MTDQRQGLRVVSCCPQAQPSTYMKQATTDGWASCLIYKMLMWAALLGKLVKGSTITRPFLLLFPSIAFGFFAHAQPLCLATVLPPAPS